MQPDDDGPSQEPNNASAASELDRALAQDAQDTREARQAVASGSRIASNRIASRSPHPYHRRSSILENPTRVKPDLASQSRKSPFGSSTSLFGWKAKRDAYEGTGQHLARRKSRESPNESGTEADDESATYIKALPAPPLRPRKGLKMGMGLDGAETPLLTPSAIDEEGKKYFDYPIVKSRKGSMDKAASDQELKKARAKFVKRRRAEMGRRASEVLLLIMIGMLVLGNELIKSYRKQWYRAELLSHVVIVSSLYLLYPIRLIAYSWKRTKSWKPVPRTIRLPAAFDPAPILYPQFIPVMIALILLPTFPKVLLPNLVLSLASIPGGLFRFGDWDIEPVRWVVSIIPLIASEHTDFPHKVFAIKPYILKTEEGARLSPEVIAALYPLHQELVRFLQYLITTSLLPAEVHLMSIGLINLLLCAEIPHSIILMTLLWLGGLSVYVLIGPVIRWNIALARVPRWRFRRVGKLIQMRQSFLTTLNQALIRTRSTAPRLVGDSDADDDHEEDVPHRKSSLMSLESIKTELLDPLKTNIFSSSGDKETQSAVEPNVKAETQDNIASKANGASKTSSPKPRRNTLPNLGDRPTTTPGDLNQRKRRIASYGKTLFGQPFSSLTHREATARKWCYSAYTYAILLLIIFGPIRNLIGKFALNGHEPFGWAFSYLLGNGLPFQRFVWEHELQWWIPLPDLQRLAPWKCEMASGIMLGRADCIRIAGFQPASTRLLLCAWCVLIIILGLGVVLSFTFVEVDTRRKVFHGMMVAMLLPTIFVDPAFISLALIIILAVFLILDLIRASQLPPLSRPIANFLTPYVDGRDLRGPVVVSHIFLLIGCAVPLWLSLAGSTFSGEDPWKNWEVDTRDVSMIAGVVCVGMGDAAASLIGRRYGRRKWPWTGGKSLEGSAAFALAVTIGLAAAKAWLRFGQWKDPANSESMTGLATMGSITDWMSTVTKAGVAACGASFMEAVLTGGNDNVVVPVILWILVKALDV